MKERLGRGHLDRFYQTLEQRFLGDEQFVDKGGEEEKGKRAGKDEVKFPRLVEEVASCMGLKRHDWWVPSAGEVGVEPRSLLVYAARAVRDQSEAEHLHRDASMTSRLYTAQCGERDSRSESELQRWLNIKSTN
jgi:hypothetical protein